jgi:hypothetical protein
MAALTTQQRTELFAALMRTPNCPGGVTKTDLLAAVNAADDWADANAGSFNAALPLPARNVLTARQKAALLMFVISKRFEVS